MQLAVFALAAIVAAPVWYVLKLSVATAGCDWRDARVGYFRAYCAVEEFGDYEHWAYYFKLEPNAARHLANAEIIFLGNSRAQFASTRAVRSFFELHPVPYYLILPDLTGIGTLDGSHLEQQSAERWSAAFLQEYAPIMERCLNTPGTADPSQTSSHRP